MPAIGLRRAPRILIRPRAQIVVEIWRRHYNPVRPYGSLGDHSMQAGQYHIDVEVHQAKIKTWLYFTFPLTV